ncbi:hypothetical protein VF21_04058 [Pseudogymnoascus sp. 05NY08]|nr:hypothetical protein VF21_04058 [Pseudogymnoascus sp. 05NY08]
MSKPKKAPAIQKKKIKHLQARLRTAIKKIRKLKRMNRALQHIKSPPRTFKYLRPRIVKTIELKTFHRFSNRPLEIRFKSHPRPLTLNPRNPPPLHHVSNTRFQTRIKSRPRPQITKPPELKEFHYFPYLPFEIQVPIWKMAIKAAPGRGIILRVDPLEYRESNSEKWAEMSSSTEIPALLHVCHLSRMLALEMRWDLCMGAYAGGEERVYLDVDTDSLCFPSLTLLWHWQGRADRREVRRISNHCQVYVLSDGTVSSLDDEYRPRRNDVRDPYDGPMYSPTMYHS